MLIYLASQYCKQSGKPVVPEERDLYELVAPAKQFCDAIPLMNVSPRPDLLLVQRLAALALGLRAAYRAHPGTVELSFLLSTAILFKFGFDSVGSTMRQSYDGYQRALATNSSFALTDFLTTNFRNHWLG